VKRQARIPSFGPTVRGGRLSVAAAAALLLLFASTALALQTHNKGDGLDPVPTGAFAFQGLAVDQSAGDVYAVDQFDPTTFAHGMLHRFHSDGSYDGAFATATASFSESLQQPQDGAVDNTGASTDGRIYVADTANNRVLAIDATGAAVAGFGTSGQINGAEDSPGDPDTVPPGSFSSPCGVAVDQANGNLFVSDQGNNRIWIFDPSGAYLGKVADSALNGPCGLAFTSSGDLYVRNANDGKVIHFDRSSATEYSFASTLYAPQEGEPGATDVAVDTATDHVYVDKGDRISEYDSSGSPVSTFGQDTLGGSSAGIAIDSSSFELYASAGNRIATFGPLVTLPDVMTGKATDITDVTATLRGNVDPAGLDTTDCHFEYDTAPYVAGEPSHGTEIGCLAGDVIPAAGGAVEVGAPVTGLSAATTYHYRLVVANSEGESQGSDQSFTTVGPPTVSRTFVAGVGAGTATLNADLNPSGAAATWHFEYVDEASFQASGFANATKVPVPDAELEAGTATLTVSQALTGLEPDTRYRYRLVASNFAGPLTGPERSFTTDAIVGVLAPGQFPGQGFLPDNRAWEMVSPPDKHGGTLNAWGNKTLVAPDGNRVAYAGAAAFGDVQGTGVVGNTQYVAIRGANGWTSHAVTPKTDPSHSQGLAGVTIAYFNPAVTRAVVTAFDLPQITGDMSEGLYNLYREDVEGPANLTPLTPGDELLFALEGALFTTTLLGGDPSFDRVFFATRSHLHPDVTPFTENIYEWEDGTLRVAGRLPDGSIPPAGSETAIPEALNSHAYDSVSTDGSRVLFRASMGGPTQLLMRMGGSSTTWVSESEGPASEAENVEYQWATPDLNRVAFTTTSQLTNEDPGGEGEALYIYTDSPDPENETNLEFVYRDGFITVSGMSDDATRGFLYGAPPTGQDDGTIYRWDGQGVHEVTSVRRDQDDRADLLFAPNVHGITSGTRVSANGRTMAFLSREELTDAALGVDPGDERFKTFALYVYDTNSDKLVCASCPPSGEATSDHAFAQPTADEDGGAGYAVQRNTFATAGGRRVFSSGPEGLVPADTNGRYDAYQYDVDTGRHHLLSSGHSPKDSWFASASPSGNDAFIYTFERLSGHDVDTTKDLYDARVGGGLPEPLPPPAQCEGDACQPAPVVLSDQSAASESFAGAGDPKARNRKRSRKHRCRRAGKQRAGKQRCKRKAARHRNLRANTERRASK
jgi:NHL repeat